MPPIERGLKRKFSHVEMDSNPTNGFYQSGSDSMVLSIPQEAAAGKVQKIRLQNFMCHESLEISLNEKVNLIVGQNGSGKSTILTALDIGLGTKITENNKRTNLKEFVKEGETTAEIEITLSNTGINAYRPDVYGETITICRSIGLTDSYEIKNSSGQTITTAKSELKEILVKLNIQVGNPICILNQNLVREFLIGSDASKLYQLFLKANKLDDIKQKFDDSVISVDHMETLLKESNEFLEAIEKIIENLEKDIIQFNEQSEVIQHQTVENDWYKMAAKKLGDSRSAIDAKKIKIQKDLAEFRKAYNDLQDVLQEKIVEKEHSEKDHLRALQEKMALVKLLLANKIVALNDQSAFATLVKQQFYESMAIYGPEVPQLLKRIDEEAAKGNFKQKPRGPLGAYFKLKDEQWVFAVEQFLSPAFIESFCVANEDDETVLQNIMREVYGVNGLPHRTILVPFSDQIIDTSSTGCYLSNYDSILSGLEILDPVVGNCLIERRKIQSVLLIPNDKEAKAMMSNHFKVPKNCKNAITLDGTLLYPDPGYRAYCGSRMFKARYLLGSTDRKFEEELNQAQDVKETVDQLFNSQTKRIARYQEISKIVREKQRESRMLENKVEKFQSEHKFILTLNCKVNDLDDKLRQLQNDPKTDMNKYLNFMKTLCNLKITSSDDAVKEEVEIETDQVESYENLEQQLIARKAKFNIVSENKKLLEENIVKQKESSKMYKEQFETLKVQAAQKVQDSFQEILRFIKYQGSITFDHEKQTLELKMNPANDAEALPATSMAMVAFIMTLWDVTNLPFYFLDEFDVFEDKGLRHKVIEILLEYTKQCPHKQFGFLSPLDTAYLVSDDSVSIHRLDFLKLPTDKTF